MVHETLQVMSPRMNQEPDDRHVAIEVPSSPSDTGMTIDSGSNPLPIEAGSDPMPVSVARSDPQQSQNDHRIFELEEEVASLQHALLDEHAVGQSRNQEVNIHLRQQARLALDYQREEYRSAAQKI